MRQPSLFEPLLPDSDTKDEVALATALTSPDLRHTSPGVQIATYPRGEFLVPISVYEFPNLSSIIRHRAENQGVRFYETMMGTDADMAGFFRDLTDNVLHFPMYVRAASPATEHQLHKKFIEFVIREIPNFQNARRHFHQAYPRGFSVTEKVYKVVDRGEWSGAVIYADLLDRPARWFTFDLQGRLRFKTLQNTTPGELLPQEKFIVASYGTNSSPWGEAMLDGCYWPWYLRHHAFKNQAIFFEKWAVPTATVEYEKGSAESTSKKNREEAMRVANAIQADTTVAFPKGMVLALLESTRNGTISFEQYIDQLRNVLSRFITGQILLGSGDQGGSYAMAKVHQEQEGNRVEALSDWEEHKTSRVICRDMINRNFGPQDAYPTIEILSRNLAQQQAWLNIESAKIANGHKVSVAHSDRYLQAVTPENPADELIPSPTVHSAQPLVVPPNLAAPSDLDARPRVDLAQREALHADASARAKAKKAKLSKVGAEAVTAARPAIKKLVKSLGSVVRSKGKKTRRGHLIKALKGAPGTSGLGNALHGMLQKPGKMSYATPDEQVPPDISDAAKIALALQVLAIAERIYQAAQDAPDEADSAAIADSLTDPEALAIDEAFGNLFEGTHSTNIASVATAKLRQQLSDPKFRRANPYVMIVTTNPNVRLSHRVLDGFIMSAEEARYSPYLPPFGFGCDCQAVTISASQAAAMGLTGSQPVGSLEEFLLGKGITQGRGGLYQTPDGQIFTPGAAAGFVPAYSGTDLQVSLAALRAKAEEIRAQDPEAWATLHAWLLWLFLYDVLREDPPPEDQPALDQEPN